MANFHTNDDHPENLVFRLKPMLYQYHKENITHYKTLNSVELEIVTNRAHLINIIKVYTFLSKPIFTKVDNTWNTTITNFSTYFKNFFAILESINGDLDHDYLKDSLVFLQNLKSILNDDNLLEFFYNTLEEFNDIYMHYELDEEVDHIQQLYQKIESFLENPDTSRTDNALLETVNDIFYLLINSTQISVFSQQMITAIILFDSIYFSQSFSVVQTEDTNYKIDDIFTNIFVTKYALWMSKKHDKGIIKFLTQLWLPNVYSKIKYKKIIDYDLQTHKIFYFISEKYKNELFKLKVNPILLKHHIKSNEEVYTKIENLVEAFSTKTSFLALFQKIQTEDFNSLYKKIHVFMLPYVFFLCKPRLMFLINYYGCVINRLISTICKFDKTEHEILKKLKPKIKNILSNITEMCLSRHIIDATFLKDISNQKNITDIISIFSIIKKQNLNNVFSQMNI